MAGILATHLGRERVLCDCLGNGGRAGLDVGNDLLRLYREETGLLVPFFAADYATQAWCGVAWWQMRELLQQREGAQLMPFSFEDALITGALPIAGCRPIGTMSATEVAASILRRVDAIESFGGATDAPKVTIARLPQSGGEFRGRKTELALLDQAWNDANRTHIVVLVAPGGVGKTSLVNRWLEQLKQDGWRGARRVYAWSFYSKGTGDERQASEDQFLAQALAWFDVPHDAAMLAWDKAQLLAKALNRERSLLILDGVEPLQHPPGPMAGQLRAPGLHTLLCEIARAGHPGLCVVTTREAITDLDANWRTPEHEAGTVVVCDVGNLSELDGAGLLHHLGVRRAGAARILPDDVELRAASRAIGGHALALTLLGKYLSLSAADGVGDIRRRDNLNFAAAGAVDESEHAFEVMAAYERWFQSGGDGGRCALAAVRLLGLFDHPAEAGCLAALRGEPAIPGLTEPLVGLSLAEWNSTLNRLRVCGLVSYDNSAPPRLDAHPLLREHFARQLRTQSPAAWRAAHERLYDHLRNSTVERPNDLAGLQPLYSAVAHGCLAGLHQDACVNVYWKRVLRDSQHYSWKHFGSFGSELEALTYFFVRPWDLPSPNLSEDCKAWVLNQAAIYLGSLGRLEEALEPAALNFALRQKQLALAPPGPAPTEVNRPVDGSGALPTPNPPASTSNLAELDLDLGRIQDAIRDAEEALEFAHRTNDPFLLRAFRTTLGHAEHQAGNGTKARESFEGAEALHAAVHPGHPKLVSTGGFRYCVLLLADVEREAWRVFCAGKRKLPPNRALLATCEQVESRARETLRWAREVDSPLDLGLDQLTLARVALYRAMLGDSVSSLKQASEEVSLALDRLGASGYQDYLARGLISRAWLRFLDKDSEGAASDLAKAWQFAERSGMRLHLADIHLHRARLFRDRDELKKARALIEQCGYWRRKGELDDAEAAAGAWPANDAAARKPPIPTPATAGRALFRGRRRRRLVILIHGIRTRAEWTGHISHLLEQIGETKVETLGYGYFDVCRFLCPGFTRRGPVNEIERKIRSALRLHRGNYNELIFVSHSFGTYILTTILRERPDIQPDRVLLCGSIVSRRYPWDQLPNLPKEVLNEVGGRDIWPVLASSVTWGYGSTGTFGFQTPGVRDRFHDAAHSDYFEPGFAENYWVPWIRDRVRKTTAYEEGHRPPTPFRVNACELVPLKWLVLLPLGLLVWRSLAW